MKHGLTLLFVCLFSAKALGESAPPFLGKWKLSAAPENLPKACTNASINFEDHSNVSVFDGVVEGDFEYSAEKNASGDGYNVIVKSIQYSKAYNCAGNSLKNIPKGKLQFYFVQISEDKTSMRIYESQRDFLTYKRAE